jgi:hypothetical protein
VEKHFAAGLGQHLGDTPAHGAGSDDSCDLELHCHVLDYCRFGIAARRVGGSDLPLFDKAVREFVKLP